MLSRLETQSSFCGYVFLSSGNVGVGMELAQSLSLTFLLRGESNLPQQKLLAETARAPSGEAVLCMAVFGEVEGILSSKIGFGATGRGGRRRRGAFPKGFVGRGAARL